MRIEAILKTLDIGANGDATCRTRAPVIGKPLVGSVQRHRVRWPFPAQRMTRRAMCVRNYKVTSMGNWVSAQMTPITASAHFVETQFTPMPIKTADTGKSAKKLDPATPHFSDDSAMFRIIGTAASPMTASSAT